MLWRTRTAQRLGQMALRGWSFDAPSRFNSGAAVERPDQENPLLAHFTANCSGPGIWKWMHYFEMYHRHLAKFVGREVHALEIGVYSGGSLGMWRDYFGSNSRIYGVDIEPACRAYEGDRISIHIGDQQDRTFWSSFKTAVPTLDVAIDDGGHEPEQQIVTFEEIYPHLRPGGVYICEDVHDEFNDFGAYASGLIHKLNAADWTTPAANGEIGTRTSTFQRTTSSIHFYPFAVVLEKSVTSVDMLHSKKQGTQWQPFL